MEQQFKQTVVSIKKGREFLESEIDSQVETNLADIDDQEAVGVDTAGDDSGDDPESSD